ncbi:hypothetical protein VR41_01180 [Streptomyces sp. NRRL B-1568]|nr:hypothetical protein VR41_01180 [Streptomyces sp. NRRL B-1568]
MNTPDQREKLDRIATADEITGLDFTGLDLRPALARRTSALTARRCTFDRARLRGAGLAGSVFDDCTAVGADFEDAVLVQSSISGGSFASADFTGADLADAAFDGTDLAHAVFARAMLDDAAFTGCRMTGANLADLRGLAVTLTFTRCAMQLADLHRAPLRGIHLTGCDLTEADLRGADLREAVFDDCKLRESHLDDALLEDADLRGADLGEITERTVRSLRGAVISPAQAAAVCATLGLRVHP